MNSKGGSLSPEKKIHKQPKSIWKTIRKNLV